MSRFYITLPSNSSMDYYPENTVARYTTKLNNSIELDGEWEVGLTEVSFPFHLNNVTREEYYFMLNNDQREATNFKIALASGFYDSFERLAAELHDAQVRHIAHITLPERAPIRFSYVTERERVQMTIVQNIRVTFSPALAHLLGFEGELAHSGDEVLAGRMMDLSTPSVSSVYVYCDLVEHVPVGDTKAPLLRIANRLYTGGINVHHIFNPVMYLPLQKKCFDTVEINLMVDTGKPVPFQPGKAFAILEFRRAAYKYFAM